MATQPLHPEARDVPVPPAGALILASGERADELPGWDAEAGVLRIDCSADGVGELYGQTGAPAGAPALPQARTDRRRTEPGRHRPR